MRFHPAAEFGNHCQKLQWSQLPFDPNSKSIAVGTIGHSQQRFQAVSERPELFHSPTQRHRACEKQKHPKYSKQPWESAGAFLRAFCRPKTPLASRECGHPRQPLSDVRRLIGRKVLPRSPRPRHRELSTALQTLSAGPGIAIASRSSSSWSNPPRHGKIDLDCHLRLFEIRRIDEQPEGRSSGL